MSKCDCKDARCVMTPAKPLRASRPFVTIKVRAFPDSSEIYPSRMSSNQHTHVLLTFGRAAFYPSARDSFSLTSIYHFEKFELILDHHAACSPPLLLEAFRCRSV